MDVIVKSNDEVQGRLVIINLDDLPAKLKETELIELDEDAITHNIRHEPTVILKTWCEGNVVRVTGKHQVKHVAEDNKPEGATHYKIAMLDDTTVLKYYYK